MLLIKNKKNFLYFLAPLILILITGIVYYPSLKYSFQFDDGPNITKFFNIRHFSFWDLFLTGSRWISYWLNTINYKIGGFNPLVYRVVNLSFHLITGLLVFTFIYLILNNLKTNNYLKQNAFKIAILTMTIFLLHPVQTQTVSYIIQGQLEGLASLFVMSILILFIFWSQTKNFFIKYLLFCLIILFSAFSTGTKEIAIVSPFLLMLTDWFFIAQGNWKSYKKRIPIHLTILITVFGFYLYFLKPTFFIKLLGFQHLANNNMGNIITQNPTEYITPGLFFISQFKVILHYFWIFIWPFNISVEYDWKLVNGFYDINCLLPLLLLLLILFFIIYLLKKDKINAIAFGFIWFFICILPRSSFIPSAELLMDYKTYLASVGYIFFLSLMIIKLCELISKKLKKSQNIVFSFILFLFIFTLSFFTYTRNKVWRTALEFWENIVLNAPGKARGYNNYGVELSLLNRHQEAIPFFKKAIKMEGRIYWDPYTNLASSYAILDKMDMAIATLEKSLSINPYQPEAYNNLGTFFLHLEEFDKAEKAFKNAMILRANYGRAMCNMGRLYLMKGDIELAWQYFRKCCVEADLDHDIMGFIPYATTSMNLKKYDDAIFACSKVISIAPESPEAREAMFNMGNCLYLKNEFLDSAKVFGEFIKKYPKDTRGWCNVIECYIALENPQKALDYVEQAKRSSLNIPALQAQEARCLAMLGYIDVAIDILKNFIKRPDVSTDLKIAARQVLQNLLR